VSVRRAVAAAVDAGDLAFGEGLLALVRPALAALEPGGVLAVLSDQAAVEDDLVTWCRAERHVYLARERAGERAQHLIERGPLSVPRGERESSVQLARFDAASVLAAVPFRERGDAATGFAPRGAQVEPGGPAFPFTLLERDRVAPPRVAELYDQATRNQWSAEADVPWHKVEPLAPALERALAQVLTFLAENELSALYLPSKFVARIHPHYAEVAMFLATQLADEARHIDVFLKRARAGGAGLGVSSVTTSQSLLSLLELEDFTEASFLLSVLGEGTFLDLLRFIEDRAPDEATHELVRRARADEARHVHFGMAHVAHVLAHDASVYARLEAAVRRRSATMSSAAGVPAPIGDALVILAAGGTDPRGVRRGHAAFRELLQAMHDNRRKRLETAGFNADQARTISELHTPNFM
jgi:TusA-related sulfurtransferase